MPVCDKLRTPFFWGTALTMTPMMAGVAGMSALAGDRDGAVWWRASRLWADTFIRSAGVEPLIVEGMEKIMDGAPYLLMANHQSHLDPPSLIRASDRPIGFLTKAELRKLPVFGWALERTGHVFIDRKNRERAHASVDEAAARVAEGACVLVFPEGTRSKDGRLGEFKKGGFVLAIKAGVPVIPIGIAGTREILPSASAQLRGRGPVAIVVGDPIESSAHTLEEKERLMDEVRAAIVALTERAETLVKERR